jgi:hypothetical protein
MSNKTLGLLAFIGVLISLALLGYGFNRASKPDPCLAEYARGFQDATIYYHLPAPGINHKKPLYFLKGKDYGLTD